MLIALLAAEAAEASHPITPAALIAAGIAFAVFLTLGDGVLRLHPRLARRHEDHLVEVELLLHLARSDEVAMVDGVEGAAHDADALTACALRRGLTARHPPAR